MVFKMRIATNHHFWLFRAACHKPIPFQISSQMRSGMIQRSAYGGSEYVPNCIWFKVKD